jgi:hypothetical protein
LPARSSGETDLVSCSDLYYRDVTIVLLTLDFSASYPTIL